MFRKHKIGDQDTGIDEDRLLAYIEGNMPPEEEHRLETILEADPFLSDAVEGLAEIKDREQLRAIAAQINVQLRRQIKSRRQRRRRRTKLTESQGWLMVLIVLLLVLLGWWVIRMIVK